MGYQLRPGKLPNSLLKQMLAGLRSDDPRVLVGLGSLADPVDVRVIWPGGRVEEWRAVPEGRYSTLTEGSGR